MSENSTPGSARRVFLHGAGRQGESAWPRLDHTNGEFLSFDRAWSVAQQAAHLAQRFSRTAPLLFAHSIGAVPAALAASDVRPRGLVLVEPALYDIARGDAAIERHIAIVTEARSQAPRDLAAFWAILRPLMFGGPFDSARWDAEHPVAEHWATTNVPWGHGVRAAHLRGIPMLVVTGGWNHEYEAIAAHLTAIGARHEVLAGADHRPQDVDGFAELVAEFEASLP